MRRFLIPTTIILSALAVPAMAQGYYNPYDGNIPITGAQMTDWPSSRANTTLTGSFLRPSQDKFAYQDRYYRDRDERRYDRDQRYDDRYPDDGR